MAAGNWVSGTFPPSTSGTYKVKFRSAKTKRHQYEWNGKNWINVKGERVSGTQTDFFKWWSIGPRPY